MKKTHWLRNTIIIMLICVITGVILSVMLFARTTKPVVSATLDLAFDKAEKGKLPNGHDFSIYSMITEDLVNQIIIDLSLDDRITPKQVINSLTVKGIYPGEYAQGIRENGRGNGDNIPTRYQFILSCDQLSGLSGDIAKEVLSRLLAGVKEIIKRRGSFHGWEESEIVELIPVPEHDNSQQLALLQEELNMRAAYADEIYQSINKTTAPLITEAIHTNSLRLKNLAANDVEYLKKQIVQKGLTNDADRVAKETEYKIQRLTNQLKQQQEELRKLDKIIAAYPRGGSIYIESEKAFMTEASNSSEVFDWLLKTRAELVDNNAKIQKRLEENKTALEILGKQDSNDTEATVQTGNNEQIIAAVEEDIRDLQNRASMIIAEMSALITSINGTLLNDETVISSVAQYTNASFFSIAFIKHSIKTTGPICALGLMICMICILISRIKAYKKA